MNAIDNDSPLLADTQHAKMMTDLLQNGVMREWRLENLLEAAITRQAKVDRRVKRRSRPVTQTFVGATNRIVSSTAELFFVYADELPPAEQKRMYEYMRNVATQRLAKLEK